MATLYDASLDQFLPHGWPRDFGISAADVTTVQSQFSNAGDWLGHYLGQWRQTRLAVGAALPRLPAGPPCEPISGRSLRYGMAKA